MLLHRHHGGLLKENCMLLSLVSPKKSLLKKSIPADFDEIKKKSDVFDNTRSIHSNLLGKSFHDEVIMYLEKYPATEHVDIYLNDLNGCFRGKRVAVESLLSLEHGCYFPLSIYAMDLEGRVVEKSGFGEQAGEPDCLCMPVVGTLRPSAKDPQRYAQLLVCMQNLDGSLCDIEPRSILDNILAKFHARGLFPVMAAELEFYLRPKGDAMVDAPSVSHCFVVDDDTPRAQILEAIMRQAKYQSLSLKGVVAEADADQYELNFHHTGRVMEACEHVLAIKRLSKQVAEKYNHTACFMAKPYSQRAGSGLHFHISINDEQGNNVFSSADGQPNAIMSSALAGLMRLMPASMAILAPNVNAFRRLRRTVCEPLFSSWGYNDRSAAIRIPCSDRENQRIEYRLAGADANPYLAVAAILSGMLYGLDNALPLPLSKAPNDTALFPLFQQDALALFEQSAPLHDLLGEHFCRLWHTCKSDEWAKFESVVTEAESVWNL
ncbi:glutamine synthetase family protein [Pectobacterium carotovorum]